MQNQPESNREKFIRIGESRTQKIINMIRLLGNCSNNYVYEYSPKDVEKIFGAIESELKVAKAKFSSDDNKDNKFRLK